MSLHSPITSNEILRAIRLFSRCTRRQLTLYFKNSRGERIKALEKYLPKLELAGDIEATWFHGEKVYSIARKNRGARVSLDHEIPCAEILIRLWRCRMEESEIIPERAFRGLRIVPEGAIRYGSDRGSMLLYEFSTRKNFSRWGVVKGKLTRYRKHLATIEAKAKRDITVLFVFAVSRREVKESIATYAALLSEPLVSGFSGKERFPFWFTDYQTFCRVPLGRALTAPIYFWHDGKEWPLSHE
jgi:hypothetical protein